jgi:hypothetical protein
LSPVSVVTWTCVFVLVATAIVTLLALVGCVRLGGGDGSKHDFYLRALFGALILEIIGVSITVYASSIKDQPNFSGTNSIAPGAGATPPPLLSSSQVTWVDTTLNADWGGRDYAYTSTSSPKYKVGETVLCDSSKIGYIATCWESRPEGYPKNVGLDLTDIPDGTKPEQWCTYKTNQIRLFTQPDGKAVVGRVYICGLSVPPPTTSPAASKKVIQRTVCRADSKQRCPSAEAFVGCGDPEDGVRDLRATCNLVTSYPTGSEQAGRCGVSTWHYTCVPK